MSRTKFSLSNTSDQRSLIRWGMIGLFVILMGLIMPKTFFLQFDYAPGKAWEDEDLIAAFDFTVNKSAKQIEAEGKVMEERVYPVFLLDPVKQNAVNRRISVALEETSVKLKEYQLNLEGFPDKAQEIKITWFLPKYELDPDLVLNSVDSFPQWTKSLEAWSVEILDEIFERGLINVQKDQIKSNIVSLRDLDHHETLVDRETLFNLEDLEGFSGLGTEGLLAFENAFLQKLIISNLKPNYYKNDSLADIERSRARNMVSPVSGMVKSGEIIIRKGELVSTKTDLVLQSYIITRQEKFGQSNFWNSFFGRILVLSCLAFIMVMFFRTNRPRIFYRNRKMSMILLLMLMMTIFLVLTLRLGSILEQEFRIEMAYLVPLTMVPIILTVFFDSRTGFVGNIFMALFVGLMLPNGFGFFLTQFAAGTIAVYNLNRLRNRADLFINMSWILLAYVIVYLSYGFYAKGSFLTIDYGNLVLLGINVLLTIITYPLIYVFEKIFRLTSDLTLIELLDTNHPLIREMALKAPGTFQHSLQVSNLSEAIVNQIGGNSLLAKVGALFHDIGKMKNPSFFIENIKGKENPHDSISPEQSASIIIRHVTDGVLKGQEFKLPAEVIAFIRTHHGTSKTEYFFRKWKSDHPGEEVDEEAFTYPGPLPSSREMAAVMIADSCEAACRSMKQHDPESIEKLVHGMVENKMSTHQFQNANITFRDLEDIKTVVIDQLTSIYHGRIEYPGEVV